MTLSSLTLENFKCFRKCSLTFGSLTLLTGFNAAGKSSSVQPLLLLAQSARVGGEQKRLDLNGALVRLGTVGDVLSHGVAAPMIRFGVATNTASAYWTFNLRDSALESSLRCTEVVLTDRGGGETTAQNLVWPNGTPQTRDTPVGTLRSTVYLSAGRIGTFETLPAPDSESVQADVGTLGQFAAWWYARCVDEEVPPGRRHPHEQGITVRRQVDAHLSDLFPGAQANADVIPGTSLVRLNFRSSGQSEWLRPANIGFGLSYAFPILVALLLAEAGQVVVIDSPEAHLHPKGQSQMGRFLAKIAMAGVQVIIETHSDHVLNGVRVAVLEGLIPAENVATYFFPGQTSDASGTEFLPIEMRRNGTLSAWPAGFFDQAEDDLLVLTGIDD